MRQYIINHHFNHHKPREVKGPQFVIIWKEKGFLLQVDCKHWPRKTWQSVLRTLCFPQTVSCADFLQSPAPPAVEATFFWASVIICQGYEGSSHYVAITNSRSCSVLRERSPAVTSASKYGSYILGHFLDSSLVDLSRCCHQLSTQEAATMLPPSDATHVLFSDSIS